MNDMQRDDSEGASAAPTTSEQYQSQKEESQPAPSLEYEETPIIEPVEEYVGVSSYTKQPEVLDHTPLHKEPEKVKEEEIKSSWQPHVDAPPKKKSIQRLFGTIGSLVGIILLFVAGVGLSLLLRQFLPGILSRDKNTISVPENTPTIINQDVSPNPVVSWANYPQYPVISGITRQPIEDILFRLPPDIIPPVCDGPSCASQGTYLPGGTRFTVAGRGSGQILPDFRGKLVSDLAGQSFQVSPVSVAGKPAVEFRGLFTGTTSGGYAFSQMHGFMIEVTDKLALEVNHFTPSGVTADFASDDLLFTDIVSSLAIPFPTTTVSITPLVSPIVTSSQQLSPSPTQ